MTSKTDISNLSNSAPTCKPRHKVLASGFAGSVVTLAVLILNCYVLTGDKADKKVPAELASAATVVLSTLVAYFAPPGSEETSSQDEYGNSKSALKG